MLCLLLTIVCLSTFYTQTKSQTVSGQCGCIPAEPGQNIFCDSDFVIQAYIQKATDNADGSITYKIVLIESFKTMKRRVNKRVVIQPADSVCPDPGIPKLMKKKTYVLSGSIVGRSMTLTGCRYTVESKDVSCNEMKNLRSNFNGQCSKCRVDRCPDGDESICKCEPGSANCLNTTSNCLFDNTGYACARDHSLCKFDKVKNACNWTPIIGNPEECQPMGFFPFTLAA